MSRTFSVTQPLLGYLRRRTHTFRFAPAPESAWLHREREADDVVLTSEKLEPSDHPLDTHCRCGLLLGLMPAVLQAVSRCWINMWSFLWSPGSGTTGLSVGSPHERASFLRSRVFSQNFLSFFHICKDFLVSYTQALQRQLQLYLNLLCNTVSAWMSRY